MQRIGRLGQRLSTIGRSVCSGTAKAATFPGADHRLQAGDPARLAERCLRELVAFLDRSHSPRAG